MLTLEQPTLGHYRLLRRLCRGGMSEVYLAHDEQGGRDVAIKVVNSHYVDHVERLQREVQAMCTLTHQQGAECISILPILDYGEEGSWNYLVMPYIEHGNLREKLAKGRLSLEEAEIILKQIASALQFAHDRGILHRDIKPSNILLGDEQQVYLADFGLAKAIDRQEKDITQTGCLIGTPEYMAPELAEEAFSTSCDIYALGVLLYQMVTGEVPFKGSTPLSVYWKQMQEQPIPPSLLNPAIPGPIEEVILCALEKDPRCRFQTAQELAQAYMHAMERRQADTSAAGTINRPLQSAFQYSVSTKSAAVRVLPLARRSYHVPPTTVHRNPPRTVAAVILLVFLLGSSLWLGFFISQGRAQVNASQFLGASAQFQLMDKAQQENPTPTLGVPPAGQVSENAQTSQPLQAYVQASPKHTKQDQGHKHKHKPKPSKGDTMSTSSKCGSVPTLLETTCSPNSDDVAGNDSVIG